MIKLTTEEIAGAVNGKASGLADITSVVIDNREVTKGSLFIAIKGDRLDGHTFVKAAIDAGAAAVMVQDDVESSVPVIRVEDTKKAFLDLARCYRQGFGDSVFDFPLVALTGSVGKTTTQEMIWCVLNAQYNAHKTYMNWNNDIGLPKVLLGLEKDHTAAVVEMGMDGKNQISVLSKTALPNMAVITNIGVSHIENLGSREGILESKLEILEGLKEGSTLLLNADNDMLQGLADPKSKFASRLSKYKLKFFGIHEDLKDVIYNAKAKDIVYTDNATSFTLVCDGGEYSVELPTTGEHNVYDALAAISVGLELSIPVENIIKALKNYTPAGMREKIVDINDVTLIEDCYNASPDSVKALSQTIKIKGEGRRKIAVIASMLELGSYSEEGHRNAGKFLAEAKIDLLMTYGNEARFVAESARENGVIRIFSFDDKAELASKLCSMVRRGDVIAFKGSRGMKLEEVIERLTEVLEKGEF